MMIEDLAEHFERVQMNGNGFTALCPAHSDTTPSLRVAQGQNSYLVKCYTGCTFFEIVAAAGLQPLDFKYGGASSSRSPSSASPLAARSKLAELMLLKRRIPFKLDEIIDITLQPDVRKLAEVGGKYPDLMQMPLPDALRMHIIVMDGPVFEVLNGDWKEWGSDWVMAKRNIAKALWDTYRRERSALGVQYG